MEALNPPSDAAQVAMEPRRREILELIWDEERAVADIAEHLPISGPAVSQHLRRLRDAGLVEVRAEGRKRYYLAARKRMGSVADLLEASWGRAPKVKRERRGRPTPTTPPGEVPSVVGPAHREHAPWHDTAPDERFDEMVPWYRQGLQARLTTLLGARVGLDAKASGAADSVRRIARSLTRVQLAERFPAVGAAAERLAADGEADLLRGVDRLIGTLRQAVARDDPQVIRILVVEDSRVEALLTQQILSGPNREILMASTAEEAQTFLDSGRVDLIVLDLTLPGVDGRDLLMRLSERPLTASIPVLLLTSRTDALTRAECLALGADAYHTKPVDPQVMMASAAMMLERAAEARQLGRRDPLTGLKNRAVFLDDVRYVAAAARRTGVPLVLVLIEVDRLAQVNDVHGSAEGDRILRIVADGLRSSLRDADSLARWGGSRFAVLLSDTDAQGAAQALAKVQRVTDATTLAVTDGTELAATWHAGTASISAETSVDEAIARATRRLQTARHHAAGTVVGSDQSLVEGPRTVLVVEDDEILGDLIDHRLSREGFEIMRLSDGREALSALSRIDASAVVVDSMLPGADGFEVLARMRASPSLADVPFVMLTFGSRDDTARAFKLGASDAMTKPFAVEELVARVVRLVHEFEESSRR